jgi:phage tail tape-measure protein
MQEAYIVAGKEVLGQVLPSPFSESNGVTDAAKKAHACLDLAEKAEPHRGTSAGAVAGTVAGGLGGAAVASVLVFPPLLPLVVIGGFLGFRWGSKL